MSKQLLVFTLCFMLSVPLFSQSIQNSVVSSGGASASNGGLTIDYTIGEPVIETFTATGQTLTQGFHQTNLTVVAIENVELFSEINVYPNPAKYYVNIDIPAGFDVLKLTLYDALGRVITSKLKSEGLVTIDVTGLATGNHYLQVLDKSNNKFKTFKIIKNH